MENHHPPDADAAERADHRHSATTTGRTMLWHGGLMTLLGLLSGFGPLASPAISGTPHLAGVVQGASLFGLAGAWHLLRGSPRVLGAIKYTFLVSLYGNWAGIQLRALVRADFVQGATLTYLNPMASPRQG